MRDSFPECERFAAGSRLREICEGADDLSLEAINRYRARWGLSPLSPDDVPPRKPRPAPSVAERYRRVSPAGMAVAAPQDRRGGCCGGSRPRKAPARTGGPGTRLAEMLAAAGIPHCEACEELAARMDAWGPDGCLERIGEIVEDMLPRARQWMARSHPSVHWLLGAARLEDAALRLAISSRVRAAVAAARPGPASDPPRREGDWAYGVRTVLEPNRVRLEQYLPRTLASLAKAGFGNPWLFADGAESEAPYGRFGLRVSLRYPRIGLDANLVMSLLELRARRPDALRYAIFEDDLVAVSGLREYLESCPMPPLSYWNLYKHPTQTLPAGKGWVAVGRRKGMGALGLVFSPDALDALLGNAWFIKSLARPPRGMPIDVRLGTAMYKAGFVEYVHSPSLLGHTGWGVSTIGHRHRYQKPEDFPGEDYDPRRQLAVV